MGQTATHIYRDAEIFEFDVQSLPSVDAFGSVPAPSSDAYVRAPGIPRGHGGPFADDCALRRTGHLQIDGPRGFLFVSDVLYALRFIGRVYVPQRRRVPRGSGRSLIDIVCRDLIDLCISDVMNLE